MPSKANFTQRRNKSSWRWSSFHIFTVDIQKSPRTYASCQDRRKIFHEPNFPPKWRANWFETLARLLSPSLGIDKSSVKDFRHVGWWMKFFFDNLVIVWITKYITALNWGYKHRFSAGFHQSWVTQYRQIMPFNFAFQMKFWPGRHGAWRCGWGGFLAVFRVVVYYSFDRSSSKNPELRNVIQDFFEGIVSHHLAMGHVEFCLSWLQIWNPAKRGKFYRFLVSKANP